MVRSRYLLILFATVLISENVFAGDEDGPKQVVKRWAVSAARSPDPALSVRLIPELRDRKTGNAALLYYRAFAPEWAGAWRQKDVRKALIDWQRNPKKSPPKALRIVLRSHDLAEFDRAARRTHCDWEFLPRLREEGFAMLLPDIQSFRRYNALLAARTRFHILDGNHRKAIHSLQTGLALSKHVGDGSFLIQSMVGIAIADRQLNEVEFLVQSKDAPNCYWALSDLPRPFISMRRAIQGERIMVDQLLPGIAGMVRDGKVRALSSHEIRAMIDRIVQLRGQYKIQTTHKAWGERAVFAVLAAQAYPKAKQFLIGQGVPKKVVEEMPISQAAMLYEIWSFDRYYDDAARWYGFPYPVMQRGLKQARGRLEQAVRKPTIGVLLTGFLLPAIDRVLDASYRVDRRIAALRCVEALRMHAAEQGAWPQRLADVKAAPMPLDPMTGKQFGYELRGDVAIVTVPAPAGADAVAARNHGWSWTYELSLRK